MGHIRDIELSVWSEILVVDFIRNIIHSCSVSPLTCNPMIPYDAIFPWLHTLSDRFPVINSLMSRINLRKKRDTLILGAVISGCVVFLLWWVLRWACDGGSAAYVNILYSIDQQLSAQHFDVGLYRDIYVDIPKTVANLIMWPDKENHLQVYYGY